MPYKRIRKRKRRDSTPSLLRSLAQRWKRLLQRLPEGALYASGFAIALLAGLLLFWRGDRANGIAAAAACSLGVTGLLWQGWMWRQWALEHRRRREKMRVRSEQRALRHLREAREQEERQRRATTDAAAHAHAREVRDERRQDEAHRAAIDELRRRARDETIAQEAMRLLTLNESGLMDAAVEAFEDRGFAVTRGTDEAECDLLLRGAEGDVRVVARRAPRSRRAEVIDVQALEAWRAETGATTACLISMAGFSPAAVRLAAMLPITLVEAHLLAQWRCAEDESSRK